MGILFISFAIFILIGVPISISIGASAVLASIYFGLPLFTIGQRMISGVDSFLLIAVPLFIMSGNLMNAGKITDKIFDTAKAMVGWIPGGLAHANVMASIIFAGKSGSAVADAGGLGAIQMKAMTERGYTKEFSASISAASSIIGPITPPSIPLIIYGSMAGVSIARLFLGGLVPGALIGISLMMLVGVFAYVNKFERYPFSLRILIRQFIDSFFSLITPVIIIIGFVSGWITPTEASSVAVIYALFISVVIYRSMQWKDFKKCLLDSAAASANTLFIIGASALFSYIMVRQGISREIGEFLFSVSSNPLVILLIINIILLIMGLFMEPGAIITLMLPILIPVVSFVGVDLVHFGVVMVVNVMIGQVSPPFGVCLFVLSDVGKISIERLSRAILPFLIPLVAVLLLITYVPGFVLWLPNMIMGTP